MNAAPPVARGIATRSVQAPSRSPCSGLRGGPRRNRGAGIISAIARRTAADHQRARPGRRLPVFHAGDRGPRRVKGRVRNLPDGRVEAYVEGESEAVTRVERALRQGPRGARVDAVEVDAEEPSGAYRGFEID